MEQERREEVIDSCLKLFVSKGLSETSTRDLSGCLKLQNAGLYYYFKSRNEAVIACVEEAMQRIESNVILAALEDAHEPDRMMRDLYVHADEMAPTMRFIVQAYTSPTYHEALQMLLDELRQKNEETVDQFAAKLGCKPQEVKPYMYSCMAAMTNYMIFGSRSYADFQIEIVRKWLKTVAERNDRCEEMLLRD